MNVVCAGLGDHVEHAAAGPAELDAEVRGLNGHLLDSFGDIERLRRTGNAISLFSVPSSRKLLPRFRWPLTGNCTALPPPPFALPVV